MKLKEKTMKLSDNTLTILKNFAGINNSILVKQGKPKQQLLAQFGPLLV
jgi:hypothetical protein